MANWISSKGGMAERLRTGLQIRVHRFESGYHLHSTLALLETFIQVNEIIN